MESFAICGGSNSDHFIVLSLLVKCKVNACIVFFILNIEWRTKIKLVRHTLELKIYTLVQIRSVQRCERDFVRTASSRARRR